MPIPDSSRLIKARVARNLGGSAMFNFDDLRRQCDELAQILARYAPRPATPREVLETLGDDERSGRCVSCARTCVARGVARWEPAHRGDLCRWCYDWRRRTGQVPPLAALDRHHRGIRDRRPA